MTFMGLSCSLSRCHEAGHVSDRLGRCLDLPCSALVDPLLPLVGTREPCQCVRTGARFPGCCHSVVKTEAAGYLCLQEPSLKARPNPGVGLP